MAQPSAAAPVSAFTQIGFLLVAIGVVTLVGIMASSLSAVPLQRALARETVLDEALTASRMPDAAAALERLRPRLAESAKALLPPAPDIEARIAAERVAMRARLLTEAAQTSQRMQLMVGMAGLMAAAYAAAMLTLVSRRTG